MSTAQYRRITKGSWRNTSEQRKKDAQSSQKQANEVSKED
jgi:hypothetical protein